MSTGWPIRAAIAAAARALGSARDAARRQTAPPGRAYFVVEKILADGEQLPIDWETDGTTGYDFMDEVSALQHDAAGRTAADRSVGARQRPRPATSPPRSEPARRQILQRSFSAQLEALSCAHCIAIAQGDLSDPRYCPPAHPSGADRDCWSTSRSIGSTPASRTSRRRTLSFLAQAVAGARRSLPAELTAWLVEFARPVARGSAHPRRAPMLQQAIALARFQQLSAPLSRESRGGHRLLSLRPAPVAQRRRLRSRPASAAPSAEFHRRMQARAADFPHAMLATATHDHKRGEDVRARLAVLSELAGEWDAGRRAMDRALSAAHCAAAGATPMPSAGDIAMLLQTIVGAWPLGLEPTNRGRLAAFAERIAAWQQKALREAKLLSDWSAPNESLRTRAPANSSLGCLAGPSELLAEIAAFARAHRAGRGRQRPCSSTAAS